ncbi:MAG: type I-MYXAN CRISPR-associated protein Cas6/Cmx6 [Gammaproteobacteria bacterium]
MYWEERDNKKTVSWPDDVVDLVYPIACHTLPVDHSYALGQAVVQVLSWLPEEEGSGVHPIQVAISAHGWERPAGADDLLHLSKRTRLVLRVPRQRMEDAKALVGRELVVRGQTLIITGEPVVRPLQPNATLYSRNVALSADDEDGFLHMAAELLEKLDIPVRKMLPGKITVIDTPDGPLATRSLMLADLAAEESIHLQQRGLGPCRYFGCGLFIPYKGIKAVNRQSEG